MEKVDGNLVTNKKGTDSDAPIQESQTNESFGLDFGGKSDVVGIRAELLGGINMAILKSVSAHPNYTKKVKNGDDQIVERAVIDFTFTSLDKERETTFRFFDPTIDKNLKPVSPQKAQQTYDFIISRYKNIYAAYLGKFPDKVMFAGCKSVYDAFAAMSNSLSPNGTPVFMIEGKPIPVWLKVTFYGSNRQLPITQFIERVREGKPTRLEINPTYDIIEPTAPKENVNSVPGMMEPDMGDYPDPDFDSNVM